MKQIIFSILVLLILAFCCNAQIKDIADSIFANISVSEILVPITKESLKAEKKNQKKKEKD